MIKYGVLLAAGKGTRLRPLTLAIPKEALPVVDKPAIHHIASTMKSAGIERIILVTGYKKHAMMDYFTHPIDELHDEHKKVMNELDGLEIIYTTQQHQRGIADAVNTAKPIVNGNPFVVVFGDTLITPETYLKKLIEKHTENKRKDPKTVATIGVMEVENVERFGIIKHDKEFKVSDMIEKPKKEEAPSNLAACGAYVFEPEIFYAINKIMGMSPGVKNEYQITDAIKALINDNYSVYAVPIQGEYLDIGTIKDYVCAFVRMAMAHPEYGEAIKKIVKKSDD